MTAIQTSCSHHTSILPKQEGLSVERIQAIVCKDAVVTEIPFTLMRKHSEDGHLIGLYISEDVIADMREYLLTRDGLIIDRRHDLANDDTLDYMWRGVMVQIEADKAVEESLLDIMGRMLKED